MSILVELVSVAVVFGGVSMSRPLVGISLEWRQYCARRWSLRSSWIITMRISEELEEGSQGRLQEWVWDERRDLNHGTISGAGSEEWR